MIYAHSIGIMYQSVFLHIVNYREAIAHDPKRPHVLATLTLKSSRACNALAFNPSNGHLLACGLDKYRADPSVIIWDISRACMSLLIFNVPQLHIVYVKTFVFSWHILTRLFRFVSLQP